MIAKRAERIPLILLNAFLALTAIAGGIGMLIGVLEPPLELLEGSPFNTYTVPGLTLLVIVDGSALLATVLLLRRHLFGAWAAIVAAAMIMRYEIVEVLVVGSDPGLARNLQVFYFVLGLVIAALATRMWLKEHSPHVAGWMV